MGLLEEEIRQAREASEIFERLGKTTDQASTLIELAWLLNYDRQLDAAEEAASRAIELLPKKGEQLDICQAHHVLGNIHNSKDNTGRTVHHFEEAIRIASSLNVTQLSFWINRVLSEMLFLERKFDNGQARLECAKSYAVNDAHCRAHVLEAQAWVWSGQGRFEEAKSEALRALGMFEQLGASVSAERMGQVLGWINRDAQEARWDLFPPSEVNSDGKPFGRVPLTVCVDSVVRQGH